MAETINDKKVFTLLEVALSIQKTLAERYASTFWVKAEMNKLNHYPHSGHCYPELVEKRDGRVVAQLKSILWKNDYEAINQKFLTVLNEPLKDGIKILFNAAIIFDPSHGLSLRIIDIDPVFSLGELEREKQDSITRLNKEGIFHANKKLHLPLLPQRIAVISVESSKGFSDYLKVIDQNPWGYKFFNILFPSLLQGDNSVPSILGQLKRIRKVIHHFDVVAIIRGGGGDIGLSSYNNYALAKAIALFPIPVFTGIGHSTNETVSEMVAFRNAITPTELADFLIQRFHDFAEPLRQAERAIIERTRRIIAEEKVSLDHETKYFQSITRNRLMESHHELQVETTTLVQQAKFLLRRERQEVKGAVRQLSRYLPVRLQSEKQQLNETSADLRQNTRVFLNTGKETLRNLERHVEMLDPINILKRGFTITLDKDGKSISQSSSTKPGDTITTVTADGRVISIVKESNETE